MWGDDMFLTASSTPCNMGSELAGMPEMCGRTTGQNEHGASGSQNLSTLTAGSEQRQQASRFPRRETALLPFHKGFTLSRLDRCNTSENAYRIFESSGTLAEVIECLREMLDVLSIRSTSDFSTELEEEPLLGLRNSSRSSALLDTSV